MLLALFPMIVSHAPARLGALLRGGAAFIRESGKAIKEVEEGEFDMLTVNKDGTSNLRFLAKKDAARMIFMSDNTVTAEVSVMGKEVVLVDHTQKTYCKIPFDTFNDQTNGYKAPKPELNTLSLSFDDKEGILFNSNPGMENIHRWTDGKAELFTGDFGKGKDRAGTFQWQRDAKTKFPERFQGTIGGDPIEITFAIHERKVDANEIEVPKATYRDYKETPWTSAS